MGEVPYHVFCATDRSNEAANLVVDLNKINVDVTDVRNQLLQPGTIAQRVYGEIIANEKRGGSIIIISPGFESDSDLKLASLALLDPSGNRSLVAVRFYENDPYVAGFLGNNRYINLYEYPKDTAIALVAWGLTGVRPTGSW